MTNEEMERAIEFLFQGQANFEKRLEQTNQQIAETNRQLQMTAEKQREFIQFVTRHIEAQAEINDSLRGSIRALRGPIRELTAAQARTDERLAQTDERLNRLAEETDERFRQTDERLNRLADAVERNIRENLNGNS